MKNSKCRPYPPKRTRPRYFSPCDAARIAREVIKDDKSLTPEQVLACIAKGLGFTHISLSRQRTVESNVSLAKNSLSLLKIVLKKSIPLLRRINIPKVIAALGTLLSALDKLETAIDLLLNQPKQDTVENQLPGDKCKCKDAPKNAQNELGG